MNLKDCGFGKVLVFVGGETPIKLVDFPNRYTFDEMYARIKAERRDIYWGILLMRNSGNTLQAVADAYNLTKERIRQIEAKFLRKVKSSLAAGLPETNQPFDDSH